jgi:hypothetical protein
MKIILYFKIRKGKKMIKLKEYPYTFKLDGETIEVNKNMVRKITREGIEEKVSLDGDAIGVSFSEEHNDYVIVINYKTGIYVITKKAGWLGPFETAEEISYNNENGIPLLKSTKQGKSSMVML